jgi:hypothetical protein
MLDDLFRFWQPAWLLCSADDGGGDDDDGGSDGRSDGSSDGKSDGSSSDGKSDGASSDGASSDGKSDGASANGKSDGSTAADGKSDGSTGAADGKSDGAADGGATADGGKPGGSDSTGGDQAGAGQSDGQTADGQTAPDANASTKASTTDSGGTVSGISPDAASALGSASPAAAADAAGLPGGITSAADILGGVSSPVSMALDNADGQMASLTPPGSAPGFADPGVWSTFGIGPNGPQPGADFGNALGNMQNAPPSGATDTSMFGPPVGAGPDNNMIDYGSFVDPAFAPYGAPSNEPTPPDFNQPGLFTDPSVNPVEPFAPMGIGSIFGIGPAAAADLVPSNPPGSPGNPVGVQTQSFTQPGVPSAAQDQMAQQQTALGLQDPNNPVDLVGGVPFGMSAVANNGPPALGKMDSQTLSPNARIAAADAAGMFPSGNADPSSVAGGPAVATTPSGTPTGAGTTHTIAAAGSATGDPTADITSPISGQNAPKATVSSDAASALNDPLASLSDGNDTVSGGSGALASSLVQSIPPTGGGGGLQDKIIPIKAPDPLTTPGTPTLGDRGNPLGNINPDAGIYAPPMPGNAGNPATSLMPGDVPAPQNQNTYAPPQTQPDALGNFNSNSGIFDILNNAPPP